MALEDDVRTLARNPALAELDSDALRLIAFSAETRILRAGDVIFRRNEVSDGGVFVMSGSVSLDWSSVTNVAQPGSPLGPRTCVFGPGSLLGDLALISDTRRPATAIAREPSSVLKISRALFHRILDEYPDNAVRLHRILQARIKDIGSELEGVRRAAFQAIDAGPRRPPS